MNSTEVLIDLGFAQERFPVGTHICHVFVDDREREDALLQFIKSGIEGQEKTACFSDKTSVDQIDDYLGAHDLSCSACQDHGQLTITETQDIYFQNNRFDPDVMLHALKTFHEASVADGNRASRVIGEMHPKINETEGGSRLIEYEAKVSLLLKEHPVTSVCQYDASAFDGKTIMNVLRVHPLMVVKGAIVHNPFFVPPEQVLSELS